MASKKRKSKKKAVSKKPKRKAVKRKKPRHVEKVVAEKLDEHTRELFYPKKEHGFMTWVRRYSPVLVTLGIGLVTYFFLVFYLFYPQALLNGNYLQLLILLVIIFLIAGVLIYLGLRAELLFVRILSFIFVFVIFTFLLLFILLAHALQTKGM
jgi:hypothetical protein